VFVDQHQTGLPKSVVRHFLQHQIRDKHRQFDRLSLAPTEGPSQTHPQSQPKLRKRRETC
jgi:hypothetical protein